MSNIGYALRAEYRDGYLGGVLAVGTGSLDVKAALDEGDGQIVVPEHDYLTVAVLDDYPALKRVAVKQTDDEPAPVVDRFESLTATELRDVAKNEFGIENPGRSRDEVLAAVRAAANPDETPEA